MASECSDERVRKNAICPLLFSSSAIDFNGSFRDPLRETERGIFAPRSDLLPCTWVVDR